MYRYCLEVYIENLIIFYMEFKSITSVAKTIERFMHCDEVGIWFELFDSIKDKSINVKDLMRIWNC